ncbi:MAG: nodulation protein NfeD [Armatimonadetes bacterium]|nr:nodulation protein NfeD [Armatimonadota bacterium]
MRRPVAEKSWASTALLALVLLVSAQAHALAAGIVRVVRVEGSIDPATAAYILRGIRTATEHKDALLLVELDTPGGLVDSTKDIIKAMLASPVPIAVYVAPEGAMAASAGTYITVAAQIAAMAPTTHIGSATPITGEGKDLPRKVTNAMASYMETLAERRGRNAKWAVKAVREGISATETEALKLNVIDLIAKDRTQLLQKIDGRSVEVAGGKHVTLRTEHAPVEELPINPRESLLHFLANPMVLGVLVLIAMYGIIAEVSNPGAIFPGVAGGLALILVLFSSNVLPLNYTALLLIFFSFILFAVDAHVATHGVLTTGGVISLALGLFLLVDTDEPMFRMSLSFVISAAIVSAVLFTTAIGAGIRAQKRKVTTGHEGLIGLLAEARTPLAPVGRVFLEGSWWTAEVEGGEPVEAGQMVRVVRVKGLRLFVTKE